MYNAHRAFATVETIASRYAIQYGHLVELSAQQLISCDVEIPSLDGCRGGALFEAFSTVQNVSLNSESHFEPSTFCACCTAEEYYYCEGVELPL